VPGVETYSYVPQGGPSVSNGEGLSVYVPGHVSQPGTTPLLGATEENGLLSAWHPSAMSGTIGIPVKEPATYEPVYRGGSIKGPGKLNTIDFKVGESYRLRAVGLEPVHTQQMVTPNGQPVTRVDYRYQYEAQKRTIFGPQETYGFIDSDWTRVSSENVDGLVKDNEVARANIPKWRRP
jgi:hypothetical protein